MKVLFVSSINKKNNISPIIQQQALSLEKYGIKIDFFGITGNGFIGYLKNITPLKKVVRNESFDIIHAHYGLCGIVSSLARKKNPLIVSFMGDDIVGSNDKVGNITLSSKIIRTINHLYARYSFSYNIVKSEQMQSFLKRSKKVAIIPNGVNIDLFKPIKKSDARNKLFLDPQKIYILFAADPARNEKNFTLAKDAIKLINNKKLELLTIFNANQKTLNLYYNACDVVVLTSFHEGSPNVIKEAMACNCPIVSTNVGDVKQVLRELAGCEISSFETSDYSEKIIKALKFVEEKGRTKGRERIIEMGLDSDNIAKKIINIYKSVLN